MKQLVALLSGLLCSLSVLAYDCNQSAQYRKESAEFEAVPPVDIQTAQVGVAYLIDRKQVPADAAMEKLIKLMREEKSPVFMKLRAELEAVSGKLKSAQPGNEKACLDLMALRREHRYLGRLLGRYPVSRLLVSEPAGKPEATECKTQKLAEGHVTELCVAKGALFEHDYYTLRVDGAHIFTLADDYIESVELKHKLSEATSIDFPLSIQGPRVVKITGGCVPVEKDELSVGAVCNFVWGNVQIAKDIRFAFD